MKQHRRLETTSHQLMSVTRLSSVLIPFATFVYLVVAFADSHLSLRYEDKPLILLASLAWIVLGLILTQEKTRYRIQTIRWLAAYHTILALLLVSVTGFGEPVVYLWSVLLLISFIYFGFRGVTLSTASLLVVGALDGLLFGTGYMNLLENLAYSLIVGSIGAIAIGIVRGANTDQAEIDTARAQAELQQGRLTTLVNNLTDAIINLDSSGKIMLYNAATLNLLDTNTSIDGRYIDEIFKFQDKTGKQVKMSKELKSISSVTVRDDLHTDISDEIMRLELTISPIRTTYNTTLSKKNAGWIVIIRDITAAKSLEEERDEFISVVSHELRTPITVAEGTISNVQLMMERGVKREKLAPAITTAHDQIVFLSKMVNDLSTLSRAERGVGDAAEDIDVAELVHGLYNEYQPQAEAKDLALDLHMPHTVGSVHASPLYLKELLQNFITNAIKYTREGSVTIDVKVRKDSVLFTVTDTGIGISKADQKRIFDKFYRAEDYRTRETSGTGLGLYVAVKLAKKLGTKISMKSRLNHGSAFSVALPIEK
ncbi:MAG TPA: ATP-binding protein [Patescibacteria group bacterium]|nr:ATP-binding protein [Patescibacteria group bacterium]